MTDATRSRRLLAPGLLLAACLPPWVVQAEEADIEVLPTYRRSIGGVSTLNRETYFSLSDPGKNFDKRVRGPERLRYVLKELDVSFGRELGPVRAVVRWGDAVSEDPNRPGFADLDRLRLVLDQKRQPPGRLFRRLIGDRLDIAAHGNEGGYPDFMGTYSTPAASKDAHPKTLPDNLDAAAELAATIMRYRYDDFTRPRYYEPVNEPHWSYLSGQKLADWHVKTWEAVRRDGVDVLVGGPCQSVAYFYKREFGAFNGLKDFIANTGGKLDFYSFHVYDYFAWDGSRLTGRVTSGLPIEGVLDLVQAHMKNEYDRETPIVISECGGYITGGEGRVSSEQFGDQLIGPGSGFDHTMRKRSIDYHVFVSAAIGNVLAFMDHPHVVQKAVPFVLLDAIGWDPRYKSVLYTPRGFEKDGEWVETGAADFYRFFRGLRGERVVVRLADPDLQARAFVQGKRLWLVVNNLSDVEHTAQIKLPEADQITLRRYRRNDDFTASYLEEEVDSLTSLKLAGREAVMVLADYDREIPERGVIEETPHYSTTIRKQPTAKRAARFRVETPNLDGIAYATLRIGVSRPADASPNIVVKFNGERVTVPEEQTAPRLSELEYATTKLIPIERALVKERNRVEVSFDDGKGGTIGAVVLRVGRKGA